MSKSKTKAPKAKTPNTPKPKAKAKPAEPQPRKVSRPAHTALTILSNAGRNLKDIAARANKSYSAAGGKDNIKEAYWAIGYARSVLEAVGLIDVDEDGKVAVVGKVVAK